MSYSQEIRENYKINSEDSGCTFLLYGSGEITISETFIGCFSIVANDDNQLNEFTITSAHKPINGFRVLDAFSFSLQSGGYITLIAGENNISILVCSNENIRFI